MEQKVIKWPHLISLAALYASVIIGWIAYYNYQPKLLTQYGFSHFTFFLFVAQGLIMIVTPPIAGKIGDRFRQTSGNRLPIITAGISFAAMIFMAVAFTLIAEPGDVLKWLLPVLIVLWLFSMSIFTSPAISTVELFAPTDKLPTAMAIITMVSGLLYAIEPVIVNIIDALGAPITFLVGGVAVLVSGFFLKKTSSQITDKYSVDQSESKDKGKMDFGYVLILGVVLGSATTVLFNEFPNRFGQIFTSKDSYSGDMIVSLILALSAVLSVPIGKMVEKIGVSKSLLIGSIGVFSAMFGVLLFSSQVGVVLSCVLFGVFYTIVSVSALPLALTRVSLGQKVFGVGVFFSGFELPNSIFEAIINYQ